MAPLILHIDTATELAGVCISRGENVVAIETHAEQKNHASFLQPAVKRILDATGLSIFDMDAIAVCAGPGSYTGLRVGLASAKGFCYAASRPLITLNTLLVMAYASIKDETGEHLLHVPMIDARRMEVFTAVYTRHLEVVMPPVAMILHEQCFGELLHSKQLVFSGSGSNKIKNVIKENSHTIVSQVQHSVADMVKPALQLFINQQFDDLAYSEPQYLKEFFTPSHKH